MSTKPYDYKFDPIAEEKLTEVFRYIHEKLCNPKAAVDLYDKLIEEITRLRNFPESGELRYEDIRRVPVKNYWLYYIPIHSESLIYIVTVTHSTQNRANEYPILPS